MVISNLKNKQECQVRMETHQEIHKRRHRRVPIGGVTKKWHAATYTAAVGKTLLKGNSTHNHPPPIPLWFSQGWDKTNFLGRDRDQEIGLIKIYYETEI